MSVNRSPRVLIVDDDVTICRVGDRVLTQEGFEVRTQLSPTRAIEMLDAEPFDVLFTDLRMAEMGGLELLERVRSRFPDVVAIVMTGYSSVSSAVETMRLGAFDYLPKPFTPQELVAFARKAWDRRREALARREAAAGRVEEMAGLIGRSAVMQEVLAQVRKVAPTTAIILLLGERGTGKLAIAKAIHAMSTRREGRFVAVDCGAPPSARLDVDLFGRAPGGEGGQGRRGLLDEADGGTVFLDEIWNAGLDVQGRILKLVQDRELLPVGAASGRIVDLRLVIATSRDLEQMVRDGAFRESLFSRLTVFPIRVPPLRDRPEDVAPLAMLLLARVAAGIGKSVSGISEAAMRSLADFDWPGNVRQLESAVEWAAISCEGDAIEPADLPRWVTGRGLAEGTVVPASNRELVTARKRLREQAVSDLEREFTLAALSRNGWNVTRAAAEVGMLRPNFQALMRKHGIRSGREE
ncbi:MAG: sigma-54-dependent Fis family transcriptional regulator [Deltaproteobacteria bacterium]|nr:sigma-54-dependent Fis family transcriptional regulator [Deltaproteobacteria bacterium]